MSPVQGTPSGSRHGGANEEDFAFLFEESLKREDIKEGEIVRGRVIQVNKDHVVVDIGYKSEGQVPLAEFIAADGSSDYQGGDAIEVYLEARENESGSASYRREGRSPQGVGRDLRRV